jgi:hypothetical protein
MKWSTQKQKPDKRTCGYAYIHMYLEREEKRNKCMKERGVG